MVAVADHEPTAALVALIGQLGYIGVDFGLQRGSQHPPRTLADDLVDQRGAVGSGGGVVHYAKHGRVFPAVAANTGLARRPIGQSPGKGTSSPS
jgi:hypothetical protein